MLAARRRPTIRRVRDWTPGATVRPPTEAAAGRPEAPTRPDPWSMFREDDIATLVPTNSEIRAILRSDDDETVPYLRPVVDPPPPARSPVVSSPDIALTALVAVYEKRAEQLAKERAHALAVVAQAHESEPARRERPAAKRQRTMTTARVRELIGTHAYTIIFSLLCVWGTLHLLLVR